MLTVEALVRRMGIPPETPVLALAAADHRRMQVPGLPTVSTGPWPPHVAVTPGELWVSVDHESRSYPIEDIVMATITLAPCGAVRVDFVEGDPLILIVQDDGELLVQLQTMVRDYELTLAPASDARGPDDREQESIDRAPRRPEAPTLSSGERVRSHEAQVEVLRRRRRALRDPPDWRTSGARARDTA